MNVKTIKADNMLNTFHLDGKKSTESELEKNHDSIVGNYFMNKENGLTKMMLFSENQRRTRLIVKKGPENISLLLKNIAFFYTKNKIAYAIDDAGKKYIAEGNLSSLELELDNRFFFRANRQYIININHVRSFRIYEKVKVKVDMNPTELSDEYFIIISQETVPEFKKWIYTA